jgi:cation transport regulator
VKNNLPIHAQEIYKEACNSAEERYGEEDRADRVAWSAVEQKYEKNEMGEWVSKQDRYGRPPPSRRLCEVQKGWRA